MPITKFYGGFNPAWRAGHLEREIVDSISNQIALEHSDLNCVVAVPSWHDPPDVVTQIKDIDPDITVICSLSDPLGPIENLLHKIQGKVILLGYVDKDLKFDFWAHACNKFFKKYENQELYSDNFTHTFLNYNRKPHRHRIELVKLLEESNLIQHGIVTLGNSNYSVNDTQEDYIDYGSNDVVGDVGIPNDVYSLGQLKIWNKCFLNIVSETQFEFSPNVFVSEKIYKPIIGLRPFVINGSPGIYRWLKNAGFDCFDDLFDVESLSDESMIPGAKFQNQKIIIDCIKNLLHEDLTKLYKKLLPRLLFNQKLFYEYANNQKYNFKF
jgi:hypothetical protein